MKIGTSLFNIKFQKKDFWFSMRNKDGDRFVNFLGNQFLKVPILAPQMFQKRCVSPFFSNNIFINFFSERLYIVSEVVLSVSFVAIYGGLGYSIYTGQAKSLFWRCFENLQNAAKQYLL